MYYLERGMARRGGEREGKREREREREREKRVKGFSELRLQIFLKADPAACHCDTGDGFWEIKRKRE